MTMNRQIRRKIADHRYFIAGSGARVITGDDEPGLLRLWWEKRGEVEPEDRSGNVVVQLGVATEDLNRRWYERITGWIPAGWYIVALCYATAVILVGRWPWNIMLLLLLFPSWGSRPGSSL